MNMITKFIAKQYSQDIDVTTAMKLLQLSEEDQVVQVLSLCLLRQYHTLD